MVTSKQINKALWYVLSGGHRVAVCFSADLKTKVRVTAKKYCRKLPAGHHDLVVTVGRLNYQEREFIKKCRKAKSVWFPRG
jgi:hypothetical protein